MKPRWHPFLQSIRRGVHRLRGRSPTRCTATVIAVFWLCSSKPPSSRRSLTLRQSLAARRCRRPRGAWRRLKKGARCLRPADPDQEFHNLRKEAKRARYTAELIAPIIGGGANKGSDRFIRLVTEVQDVLGEHQDAVVAAHEIELGLAEYADHPGFIPTAQALLECEHDKAEAARTAFFKVWDKLDRKKSRQWLKARRTAHSQA